MGVQAFLVANPKGGSGKSTLATNLAGYLAQRGHAVMLGDIDRQQSAREWLDSRPFALPTIDRWAVDRNEIARPPKGTTHVVLDTPAGLHGKMLEKVLRLSSRVIVPVQPSTFDMRATRNFLAALLDVKAVRKGRADVAVIGMRVDARTRAAAELERFLDSFELPVLTYLRDTQNYIQASAAGLTLFDLPLSRVQRDLEQWQAIINWVESGGRPRVASSDD